jgi:1-acyl-sn-glycerol-3-phosphate acyltransferase
VLQDANQKPLKRRGSLGALFGNTVLSMMGWRIRGTIPDLPKFIIIVAPHTSNWDFIVGIAAMLSLKLSANWLGKHSLFRWPIKSLLHSLGGIPVDRTSHQGTVDQAIALFDGRDRMILGLSPEGTRKKVEKWKTGFYQIAFGAGVPIVMAGFDYSRKIVDLGPVLTPSGDLEKDLEFVRQYYSQMHAKYPENFSLP